MLTDFKKMKTCAALKKEPIENRNAWEIEEA